MFVSSPRLKQAMDIGVSRRRVSIAGRLENRDYRIDVRQVRASLLQSSFVVRNRSLDFVALRYQRRDTADFGHALRSVGARRLRLGGLAQQRGAQDRELLGDRQGATRDAGRPLDFCRHDRRSQKSASIAQVTDFSMDYPGVLANTGDLRSTRRSQNR
jgi:hypothetical protein